MNAIYNKWIKNQVLYYCVRKKMESVFKIHHAPVQYFQNCACMLTLGEDSLLHGNKRPVNIFFAENIDYIVLLDYPELFTN
jgi:hypothetical protein